MARSPGKNETRALAIIRRKLESWQTAYDTTDWTGFDPEEVGLLFMPFPDTPLDADCAVVCWLVYAPIYVEGCPLGEDYQLCVELLVDPLNLRFAVCELPNGTIIGLEAGPPEYTDGLKLDDLLARVERDGADSVFRLSMEAHLQMQDAGRRVVPPR